MSRKCRPEPTKGTQGTGKPEGRKAGDDAKPKKQSLINQTNSTKNTASSQRALSTQFGQRPLYAQWGGYRDQAVLTFCSVAAINIQLPLGVRRNDDFFTILTVISYKSHHVYLGCLSHTILRIIETDKPLSSIDFGFAPCARSKISLSLLCLRYNVITTDTISCVYRNDAMLSTSFTTPENVIFVICTRWNNDVRTIRAQQLYTLQ